MFSGSISEHGAKGSEHLEQTLWLSSPYEPPHGGLLTVQLLPQEAWAQTQHSVFLISSQVMWWLVWDYSSSSEGLDQRVSVCGLPISSISTPGNRLEMCILGLDPDVLKQSQWMC